MSKAIFYKERIGQRIGGLNAQVLLVICMLGMIFYQGISRPIIDPDIWWHLKTGQAILEEGIPSTNTFSHTASQNPWLVYSWFAEAIFYGVDNHFGPLGLIFLRAFLITLTCFWVYLTIRLETRSVRLAVILTTLAFYASPSWTLRPQLISFLFTALFVFLLRVAVKKCPHILWLLPFLMIIWANCHVYFIIGLILLVFFSLRWLLTKEKEKLPSLLGQKYIILIINLLCFLAPLVNPYFFHIYIHIFNLWSHISSKWVLLWIQELQSPNFHTWSIWLFEVIVILSILAFFLSTKKPHILTILLFIGLLHQALSHSRDITYFTIIVSSILGYHLAHIDHPLWERFIYPPAYRAAISQRPSPFFLGLNWTLIIGLVVFISSKSISLARSNEWIDGKEFPVQAVEFIKTEGLPAHMFNYFNWGGYLIYHLYPRHQVFIDGRTQVYPEKIAQDYSSISFIGSGWRSLLANYKIQWVIWPPREPLPTMLSELHDWQKVYADNTAAIFKRDGSRSMQIDQGNFQLFKRTIGFVKTD